MERTGLRDIPEQVVVRQKTAHLKGRVRLWASAVVAGLVALACAPTVEAPPEQTTGFPYTYCDGKFLTTVFVGSDGRWYTDGRGGKRDVVCEIARQYKQPVIESVDPAVVAPGSKVTIKGKDLLQPGINPHRLQVWLVHKDGGVGLLTSKLPNYNLPGYNIPTWESDEISFQVPLIPEQSGRLTVIAGKGIQWQNEFTIRR